LRRCQQLCQAAHTGLQEQNNSGDSSNNPLELLRVTYDPQQRAKLMQQLDTRMSEFSELYQPCPVEEHLSKELGVWSYNVSTAAEMQTCVRTNDVNCDMSCCSDHTTMQCRWCNHLAARNALGCPHRYHAYQNQLMCFACMQVMLFAVQNPALQNYKLETQVKPAISSLKAAGVDVTDIWFLVTKRLDIFAEPISLQVGL
jgi:hypothetical protein